MRWAQKTGKKIIFHQTHEGYRKSSFRGIHQNLSISYGLNHYLEIIHPVGMVSFSVFQLIRSDKSIALKTNFSACISLVATFGKVVLQVSRRKLWLSLMTQSLTGTQGSFHRRNEYLWIFFVFFFHSLYTMVCPYDSLL